MRGRLAFKRAVQILVLLIIILGGAELVAAYMLFRYGVLKQIAFQPTGLASVYLVEKALGIPVFHPVATVNPSPLYVPDERLGYTSSPGRYRISNSLGRKTMSFVMTVPQRGERASPPPLKWSDLRYVFWQQGGPRCRGRATSLKRSWRSYARLMF